jgi:hypothetical protein
VSPTAFAASIRPHPASPLGSAHCPSITPHISRRKHRKAPGQGSSLMHRRQRKYVQNISPERRAGFDPNAESTSTHPPPPTTQSIAAAAVAGVNLRPRKKWWDIQNSRLLEVLGSEPGRIAQPRFLWGVAGVWHKPRGKLGNIYLPATAAVCSFFFFFAQLHANLPSDYCFSAFSTVRCTIPGASVDRTVYPTTIRPQNVVNSPLSLVNCQQPIGRIPGSWAAVVLIYVCSG